MTATILSYSAEFEAGEPESGDWFLDRFDVLVEELKEVKSAI